MSQLPPTIADMMAQLWIRHLPETSSRVEILEAASQALLAGALDDDLRAQAHSAAHKLAGSLGMFGRMEATNRARACENALATLPVTLSPQELAGHVAFLRASLAENS